LLYGFDTHELFRRPRLHALATTGSPDRESAFDHHRSRSKRQQLLRALRLEAATNPRISAFREHIARACDKTAAALRGEA